MKVKAKRRKKYSYKNDDLNIVKVSDHHLVILIDEVDDKRMIATWRFEHGGKFYGDFVGFEIKPGYMLQSIKEAVNLLLDQPMLVGEELNDGRW